VPVWFDAVLLFVSSRTASLLNVRTDICIIILKSAGKSNYALINFAGSYGVYLGI
jgi:hypothetical protein